MATIVNTTPGTTEGNGSSVGTVLSVILVLAFIGLLFYYGLPMMQGAGSGATQTPQAPQIQVPEKMDVNVNQK